MNLRKTKTPVKY